MTYVVLTEQLTDHYYDLDRSGVRVFAEQDPALDYAREYVGAISAGWPPMLGCAGYGERDGIERRVFVKVCP